MDGWEKLIEAATQTTLVSVERSLRLDDERETDSDICPYCGLPMFDDLEVGQGYHVTAPCWMMGSGDHESLRQWFAERENQA